MNIICLAKEKSHQFANSDTVGLKGVHWNKLASLNFNILPSFFIPGFNFSKINDDISVKTLREGVEFIEKIVNKKLGDIENPLFLEVFLSPNLELDIHKPLRGIGFSQAIAEKLAEKSSESFAYRHYEEALLSSLEFCSNPIRPDELQKLKQANPKEKCISLLKKHGDEYVTDPYQQLSLAITFMKNDFYKDPLNKDINCAIGIRATILSNNLDSFFTGIFYSRNNKTGKKNLEGKFIQYINGKAKTTPITELQIDHYRDLSKLAFMLEKHWQEIRRINFIISASEIWIADEWAASTKSTKASITLLSDLHSENIITDENFLKNITDKELVTLLFPSFSEQSIKKIDFVKVGETGSIGVARGRVFFSSSKLLEAYRDATVNRKDTDVILCMKATYAGDVEAIEIGNGVICSEGGYASHAPVVARSLGKPAIIAKELDIEKNSVKIGNKVIKEGDYISIDVPSVGTPVVYFGKAGFQEVDKNDTNLKKILEISDRKINLHKKNHHFHFEVLANADTSVEIAKCLEFGVGGVGLCRTEHMFFSKEKINFFRLLLISEEKSLREFCLSQLKELQRDEFYEIFKVLKGKSLNVRMLDAPLHEFIPYSKEEIREVLELFNRHSNDRVDIETIQTRFNRLKETNAMLGNRGCRFGISFPEVYEMQESALLDAAFSYYNDESSNKVDLKIMFPLIGTVEEFYFLKKGRDLEDRVILGLDGIVDSYLDKHSLSEVPFPLKVGIMVEVPSAALSASKLAETAEFFSFGTNDLTQMTYGISRDDINSFYPSYTEYDIIKDNPFITLFGAAKKLIFHAISEGRLKRPDIYSSVCGEHGASADTIRFCIQNKINAVSCSHFNVPVAKLVAAQHLITF